MGSPLVLCPKRLQADILHAVANTLPALPRLLPRIFFFRQAGPSRQRLGHRCHAHPGARHTVGRQRGIVPRRRSRPKIGRRRDSGQPLGHQGRPHHPGARRCAGWQGGVVKRGRSHCCAGRVAHSSALARLCKHKHTVTYSDSRIHRKQKQMLSKIQLLHSQKFLSCVNFFVLGASRTPNMALSCTLICCLCAHYKVRHFLEARTPDHASVLRLHAFQPPHANKLQW